MEIQNQPKLAFLGVDIVDIDFKATNSYDSKSPIDLDIYPKVFYPKDDNSSFRIIMDVELISKNFFDLKLLAIGNFSLSGELNGNDTKSFVSRNAPAIMFPYVRAFISTLTSNLGSATGHLMIPTQFFKGDLEEIAPGD